MNVNLKADVDFRKTSVEGGMKTYEVASSASCEGF